MYKTKKAIAMLSWKKVRQLSGLILFVEYENITFHGERSDEIYSTFIRVLSIQRSSTALKEGERILLTDICFLQSNQKEILL